MGGIQQKHAGRPDAEERIMRMSEGGVGGRGKG